ncbi:mitochondrial inner membrane protease atp23 [Lineolata rhizophorae]|uniref:Mitochondrial inner membrane protease ATP23 n=1 Tax=Lineolata rhizophorae TaxID=578093 RepID=A0A6A6NUL2_9PEZI|nr:mitochondrial inner membrane protease atp23 [Lineolata rhizophorae]
MAEREQQRESQPRPTLPQTTTSKTAAPDLPADLKEVYSWRKYFELITGQASKEDISKYRMARDILNEERDCKRCEADRDWLLQYSPVVTFLRENINKLGHDINSTNVRCKRCSTIQSGGFDADYGILICANWLRTRAEIEDTMAHEMVHAYDYARFKVDRGNLRHQACTEIRASMLSGECRFGREFFGRNQWNITEQLQECVRRRATLSLKNRPAVKDDVHSARLVNEVWDSCFKDTRPFDEIYR